MSGSTIDMTQGPLLKRIILFTIPITLTGILQLLFNAADLVVVGRYCGSIAVAAVGSTGSLVGLVVNLFMGLSVGAGVSVAHAIGSGDYSEIHKTVHTAMPTALIGGLLLTVLGICTTQPLLRLMDTPDDVIGLSSTYLNIYYTGMVGSLIYNFGATILRAAGDTKRPLYYLTLSGALNVVLNVIFVASFKMDVAGVALATVISQYVSAILVVISLCVRDDAVKLRLKDMHIYKKHLYALIRIGVPAGLQSSMFSISNFLIQSSVNSFGSVVMSANSAAGNIEAFVWTAMNGFSQAALNFTGQNYGARKFDRIRKITRITLICTVISALVSGVLVYLFARPLLSIYITDSQQAIEYGIIRIMFICLPYFLDGMMETMTGTIRGLGYSVTPMVLSIMGICVLRVVWILTVFNQPQYHTLEYLYVTYPISWAFTVFTQLIAYAIIMKKLISKHKAQTQTE